MTERAEVLLQRLGLAYRVLLMATREMGFVQAKKYDLEVWAPGVERWLEVSSCSNFRDYQARRMAIRYRPEPGAKPELVHTLNGSGLALARTVAAHPRDLPASRTARSPSPRCSGRTSAAIASSRRADLDACLRRRAGHLGRVMLSLGRARPPRPASVTYAPVRAVGERDRRRRATAPSSGPQASRKSQRSPKRTG